MNSEALSLNFQSVYFAEQNRGIVALNIIAFGIKEFRRTFIFENLDKLECLCKNVEQNRIHSIEETNYAMQFTYNNLIDCIRISICFENFLKGILLCNGYLVHSLDRNVYPDLAKEQKKRPILLNEVIQINDWKENPKVKSIEEGLKLQIKGIQRNTLSISNLIKEDYKKIYGITNDFFDVCNPYFNYRNNLHYYVGESFSVTANTKTDFDRIIKMVRKNMIRIHDELIDKLGKDLSYKLVDL